MSSLSLNLAFRYLKSNRGGVFSFTSFLAILGLSIGVSSLIIVMSVMNGFRTELINKIVGFNAHITVKPYDKIIDQNKLNNNNLKLISNNIIYSNSVMYAVPFSVARINEIVSPL